jgi:hypothetical protein
MISVETIQQNEMGFFLSFREWRSMISMWWHLKVWHRSFIEISEFLVEESECFCLKSFIALIEIFRSHQQSNDELVVQVSQLMLSSLNNLCWWQLSRTNGTSWYYGRFSSLYGIAPFQTFLIRHSTFSDCDNRHLTTNSRPSKVLKSQKPLIQSRLLHPSLH